MTRLKTIQAGVSLTLAALMLTACTTTTTESVQPEDSMSKISVLALDVANIQIKPTDTFKWHDDLIIVGVDKDTKEAKEATARRLTSEIESTIKAHGHEFISDKQQQSDYQVSAIAALGKDGAEAPNLVLRFGVDPGLVGGPGTHYDKGALAIRVTDAQGVLLWRGIVQVFIDENVDAETRQHRTERAVEAVFEELFAKQAEAPVTHQLTN
ncbi:uncharacterized protein DUF4136 [Sinobacterium caligoides]|uniref:Uncharacterized protein DUF4136 n=1 Tax=Sinobacterium caligoides TaxID=933926 RepID=A0A3N2DPP4_9GAMM|nr:DUF4136 domain-containing protein [Sinobacterium caligoides]ROS01794.1 uncharacterized protein DUF4136 [Sinobacterium caligoides]